MLPHVQALIDGLQEHGWSFLETRRCEQQPTNSFAIFSDVPGFGRACPDGKIAKVAVPIPDDPQVQPPGFHMHPPLGRGRVSNTHESPLSSPGEEWAYWSRPLTDWAQNPTAARIVSHLNSALRDA